jgi:hypothetical protein
MMCSMGDVLIHVSHARMMVLAISCVYPIIGPVEDVYDNREKIATFLQSDGFFEIT